MSDNENKKPEAPYERPLTIKEKKFIKALVSHGKPGQAIIDAGYQVKNKKNASIMATEMQGKPKIQRGIEFELELFAPHIGQHSIERLQGIILTGNDGNALKAIETLHRLKGSFAPTQSQTLNAKVTVPKSGSFLPEE